MSSLFKEMSCGRTTSEIFGQRQTGVVNRFSRLTALPNLLIRLEMQIFESQNVSITAVVKFEDTCQVMKIKKARLA